MPLTLVTTLGAADANSYGTETEADQYFSERLFSTPWTSTVDSEKKKAALITAVRRLEQVAYVGRKATSTQALAWGRADVWDCETESWLATTTLPVAIKHAQFETANWLLSLTADPTAQDALAKFSRVQLPGGLALDLREGFNTNDALPPVVWRLLAPWVMPSDVVYLERA